MGLCYWGCAIVFIAVAVPLVLKRAKMNGWYGVRFEKAFASEDNWYKINAYGGRRLIFWSCVLALIGLITFFVPIEFEEGCALLGVFGLVLVVVLWIVDVYRFSRKL